jgi:hypothetical protein
MAEWDEDLEEYTLLLTSDFSTHNYELREDSFIELREAGGVELREGLP